MGPQYVQVQLNEEVTETELESQANHIQGLYGLLGIDVDVSYGNLSDDEMPQDDDEDEAQDEAGQAESG